MTDDAARGWADIVGPIKARFTIAAMAGMQTVHNAVGAQAVADIIGEMAAKLDAAIEREDAHTAALAAAGAAGEARGIERAYIAAGELIDGASPHGKTFTAGYANGILDAVRAIRALSPSASPALDAVVERARNEGRIEGATLGAQELADACEQARREELEACAAMLQAEAEIMKAAANCPVTRGEASGYWMAAAAICARGEKGEG